MHASLGAAGLGAGGATVGIASGGVGPGAEGSARASGSIPMPAGLPLPEWLTANPLFTAGFGLGAMGVVMGSARSGLQILETVLRRQMLMSLEISNKDHSYQWVMQWLVSNGSHTARHLGVETTYAKDSSGKAVAAFDFVPSPGRHWMRYGGTFIKVERERETKSVAMQGTPFETLTLTTLSLRPNLFMELLEEAKAAALAREEGMTVIYQCYGHEWRPFGDPKRIRPFDSVILDENVGEKIAEDVDDFLRSQAWYLDRGIPYRRGYLLHGPPGCGKSSFVMAIAGRLGYNICVLNLGDPAMTDDRLQHLLAVVPPRSIVLLEDVDFAIRDQTSAEPAGPYAGVTRVSFSGMLNALDGVVATEERIIFMTTNHFQKLPRALVRPGRVDMQVFIGLLTEAQQRQMFLRFFPGEDALAGQFVTLCQGEHISPAEIQGFFMFFKEGPQLAVAHLPQWLEERRKAIAAARANMAHEDNAE